MNAFLFISVPAVGTMVVGKSEVNMDINEEENYNINNKIIYEVA